LIVYEQNAAGLVSMQLLNADGSRAEVSGNGVRGLAALVLRDDTRDAASLTIATEAGDKHLSRIGLDGTRQMFRAAMGNPVGLGQVTVEIAGESLGLVVLNIGNPQCVLLGSLPDDARFRRVGAALERHRAFPEGTNVEFAEVEAPSRVRILIWERGVGPTTSSGTGSCAALIAAAAYGGAAATPMSSLPAGPSGWNGGPTACIYLAGPKCCAKASGPADSSYPLAQSPINFCVCCVIAWGETRRYWRSRDRR
jgi:diaminopimelate epimerase